MITIFFIASLFLSFQIRMSLLTALCRPLAHNDPAAWRSGGISISNYTLQRDVFYFHFVSAETSSHCAKPQVSRKPPSPIANK